MDIEMKERRWIKCSSLKKNILYQPVLCKKNTQGRDEGWRWESKEDKPKAVKTKTRWYKTYVKKEMMALENIKNTEAHSKSPSKRRNPGVKTKSKGTTLEKGGKRRASKARI